MGGEQFADWSRLAEVSDQVAVLEPARKGGVLVHEMMQTSPEAVALLAQPENGEICTTNQPPHPGSFLGFVIGRAARTRRAMDTISGNVHDAMRNVRGFEEAVETGQLASKLEDALLVGVTAVYALGIHPAADPRVDGLAPAGTPVFDKVILKMRNQNYQQLVAGMLGCLLRVSMPSEYYQVTTDVDLETELHADAAAGSIRVTTPAVAGRSADDPNVDIVVEDEDDLAEPADWPPKEEGYFVMFRRTHAITTRELGCSFDGVNDEADRAQGFWRPTTKHPVDQWIAEGHTIGAADRARLDQRDRHYKRLALGATVSYRGYGQDMRPDWDPCVIGPELSGLLQVLRCAANGPILAQYGRNHPKEEQHPNVQARLTTHQGVHLARDYKQIKGARFGPPPPYAPGPIERFFVNAKQDKYGTAVGVIAKLAGGVGGAIQEIVVGILKHAPTFVRFGKRISDVSKEWSRQKQAAQTAGSRIDSLIAALKLEEATMRARLGLSEGTDQ